MGTVDSFAVAMDDIHSKEFKRIYQKSKIKVRQWENKFAAENGRLPTKVDIKASPASVREYYKLYYKLKTQILEAQILGEDKPTEIPLLDQAKPDSVMKEHANFVSRSDESPAGTDTIKKNVLPSSADSNTWGTHLNKATTLSSAVEKEKCGLMNDIVAERLFKGSSFKKRNPRKALSLGKKKSSKSEEVDSYDTSSISSPFSEASVDQCLNESAFSVQNDCSPNVKALITKSGSLSPLLNEGGSVRIAEEKILLPILPVSLVQVLASDPLAQKPIRSLDARWVERCNEFQNKEDRKSSSDSGFDSMELSIREEEKGEDSSDDDVIVGSDNEAEEKKWSQKRKPEASPVVDKQSEGGRGVKKLKMDEAKAEIRDGAKKAILERKIQSGTLNDNYVRINLKKKVFVRGKKNFNFAKYKKKEWKNKKKSLEGGRESGGIVQCFKCGETGHFSKYCQKTVEDELLPADDGDVDGDDDRLPTLEEAERMAKEKTDRKQVKRKSAVTIETSNEESPTQTKVEPLYQLKEDGTQIETPPEVYETLEKFGHSHFRPGQEEAIMRILSGQSTLLTIATGGGKSLCYQLPAYLYAKRSNCITLVVSPLVSLMEDQVAGSSSFFKVGCLHTSQTQKQRDAVVDDAKKGKLFALLVSPEAVVSGDSSGGFGVVIHHLPPIAFACIDEVHCVSQWSYNFRPSYLMISKVLREKLGITTILGLTATATLSTINSITSELRISGPRGVIKDVPFPNNLCLSVSRDENKDEALLRLLKSSRFKDANAILIYCTRRDECERLAVLIRTVLQNSIQEEKKISKRLSWNAESYHAGMAAARRKQVQKAFMCGNLRIVVATVAFGMGINKPDIRGVIHYNMPKNFESYVQEVGRAGRDGMLAHCHLFLDSKGRDLNELRRHIHSDSVDRHVLRKLLQRVFVPCACEKECRGHEIAFDRADTIQALDIPEENIYTLLCYLELHCNNLIKVLSPVYVKCRIKSYKGMKAIISAAKKCPPLAYACALISNDQKKMSEVLEFNVMEVADKLGWDSGLVKSQLKNVEWEMSGGSKWKKTGIVVELSDLGFRVCSRGNLSPSELDEALEYLSQRVEDQEKRSSAQLDVTFSTFDYFAIDSFADDFDMSRSDGLKMAVRKYFETEEISLEIPVKKLETEAFDEEALAAEVRSLLCTYRDNAFNGRAVARIFHGIQSPNYPASLWFKCRFWRKHVDIDFKKIARIATREILRLKI